MQSALKRLALARQTGAGNRRRRDRDEVREKSKECNPWELCRGIHCCADRAGRVRGLRENVTRVASTMANNENIALCHCGIKSSYALPQLSCQSAAK